MTKASKLRIPDMVWLADTTHMTIYNWRQGAARKTRPLPVDIAENGEVSCAPVQFRTWCRENDVKLRQDPVEYLRNKDKKTGKKRGPKPRLNEPKDVKKEPKPKALNEAQLRARRATEEARDRARIRSKHEARNEAKPIAMGGSRYVSGHGAARAARKP